MYTLLHVSKTRQIFVLALFLSLSVITISLIKTDVVFGSVSMPGNPPTANAGTDKNVYKLTTEVSTNASASDPEGLPLTYSWTTLTYPSDGDVPVILNGNSIDPAFTNLNGTGLYSFELTVTDSEGLTASDVLNMWMVEWDGGQIVNAGTDRNVPLTDASITTTATVNDYGVLAPFTDFQWEVTFALDGNEGDIIITDANTLNPTFSNMTGSGLHTFKLTASNPEGYQAVDYLNIWRVPVGNIQWASASDCVIPSGESTCWSMVTWYIEDSWNASVKQNGVEFSSATIDFGTLRSISHGETVFTFTDVATFDSLGILNIATSTVTASCEPGTTLNGAICQASGSSAATLLEASASDCEVSEYQSTCTSNVRWSISGPSGYSLTPSIRQSGIEFSTMQQSVQPNGASGSVNRTLSLGSNTFDFYENNSLLGTQLATATCAAGLVPLPDPEGIISCRVIPTGTIATKQNPIDSGRNTTVSWDTDNASLCTVTGRYDSNGAIVITYSGTSGSNQTSPLYGDVTFTLVCDGMVLDSASITVITIPELTITPRIVPAGESENAVISWDTNNEDQTLCVINGGGYEDYNLPNGRTSMTITLTAQTTMTLSCPNPLDPANPFSTSVTTEILPTSYET